MALGTRLHVKICRSCKTTKRKIGVFFKGYGPDGLSLLDKWSELISVTYDLWKWFQTLPRGDLRYFWILVKIWEPQGAPHGAPWPTIFISHMSQKSVRTTFPASWDHLVHNLSGFEVTLFVSRHEAYETYVQINFNLNLFSPFKNLSCFTVVQSTFR